MSRDPGDDYEGESVSFKIESIFIDFVLGQMHTSALPVKRYVTPYG